ncbi:MAG: tellurite resistance TerB family protein [Deltaproteobacteria bacterium]|jgi:tellurite resistance protein|nr:tellurite resistance TerB family protein [Deltaproteobacteria bacterium]MBW2535636.1 tellurite resistance TerB family protein [Deltaproteobacteria bacterium]
MASQGDSLLERVAANLAHGVVGQGVPVRSILSQAATSYAKRPVGAEETIPTGFDPRAAVLFEAVVEAAFLVANSDGDFDAKERSTFETVVVQACQNSLKPSELHALVNDLCELLETQGIEQRVARVCAAVGLHEHKLEVLRIGALMAHISGGVQEPERAVLDQLASGLRLGADAVPTALDQAERALRG